MREVATPESPSGTIGSLELELIFDLTPWGHGRALMKSLSEEDASSEPALESYRKATFYDCQELLASVDDWMRVIRVRDRDLKTYLQEVAPGRSAAATIKRLHYGSPFQIELLLPLVSTAGLTSLFFIAGAFTESTWSSRLTASSDVSNTSKRRRKPICSPLRRHWLRWRSQEPPMSGSSKRGRSETPRADPCGC
jgi:hypothetical protein